MHKTTPVNIRSYIEAAGWTWNFNGYVVDQIVSVPFTTIFNNSPLPCVAGVLDLTVLPGCPGDYDSTITWTWDSIPAGSSATGTGSQYAYQGYGLYAATVDCDNCTLSASITV